jgi:hypothetical protein
LVASATAIADQALAAARDALGETGVGRDVTGVKPSAYRFHRCLPAGNQQTLPVSLNPAPPM